MTVAEASNLTILEAILKRPAMYTMKGQYAEVVAFIEGYISGIAIAEPYAAPVQAWEVFRCWLAERRSVVPSDVYEDVAKETEPLDYLKRAYEQFQSSRVGK